MAGSAHKVTIPSDTQHLREVRAFVAHAGAAAGLSDDAIHALQTAVDEAVANAIEHGYAGRTDGEVEVTTRVRRPKKGLPAFIVSVRHHGSPFDETRYHPASLRQRILEHSRGGYGLHLIHRLVDDVAFRTRRGTSEVVLTKQFGENGTA